jgi:hypothetical protein
MGEQVLVRVALGWRRSGLAPEPLSERVASSVQWLMSAAWEREGMAAARSARDLRIGVFIGLEFFGPSGNRGSTDE